MVLKRGSNGGGNHPGRNDRVPAVLDFASLDDLGPQARAVIVNGPLPTLAYPIVKQIVDKNDAIEKENEKRAELGLPLKPYLDPKDPNFDNFLASNLVQHNVKLLLEDRDPEFAHAGIIPLRGRYNPKTEREQRKVRRVRF